MPSLTHAVAVQLESLADVVESASAQSAAVRAACADLEQRRQQLLSENAACESAIGDVSQKNEVGYHLCAHAE